MPGDRRAPGPTVDPPRVPRPAVHLPARPGPGEPPPPTPRPRGEVGPAVAPGRLFRLRAGRRPGPAAERPRPLAAVLAFRPGRRRCRRLPGRHLAPLAP